MKYASLFVLILVAGCGDDSSSPPASTTDNDSSGATTGSNTTNSSGTSSSSRSSGSNTTAVTTSNVGTSTGSTQSSAATTSTSTSTSGGSSGTTVSSSGSTNTGDVSQIPDCDTVVSFDSAWGVVATGGGTNPESWETSVTPSIAGGVFSVEIPFTSSAQQYGWNGDYPNGPVDCTGRELVARMRLMSGFVEDPESAPGGVLMYLFSEEWANSVSAWNNVPAPSEEWFEVAVGCAASEDSAFNPALVNGIGFTFNSGGADTEAYAATTAVFEVDQLCWRGNAETADAGNTSSQTDGGAEESSDATESNADAGSPDASVLPVDAGDAGTTSNVTSTSSDDETPTSSDASDAGTLPDDCELLIDFNSPWGVVATGGGTDPESWETAVTPTVGGGIFNVTVPFSSAVQQYGWVGDYPDGPVDCTGWELVARVRLTSGFVENPQTMAGGVQMYLFSDSWNAGLNAWNVVPAPSDDWFEASVTCGTSQDSDFDPTDVNAVGFTFNTGGENASDYDADPAEFEVDYLCWRK